MIIRQKYRKIEIKGTNLSLPKMQFKQESPTDKQKQLYKSLTKQNLPEDFDRYKTARTITELIARKKAAN